MPKKGEKKTVSKEDDDYDKKADAFFRRKNKSSSGGIVGKAVDEMSKADNKGDYNPKTEQHASEEAMIADSKFILGPYLFFRNGDLFQYTMLEEIGKDNQQIHDLLNLDGLEGSTYNLTPSKYKFAFELNEEYNGRTEPYESRVEKDSVAMEYSSLCLQSKRLEGKLKGEIEESGTESLVVRAIRAEIKRLNLERKAYYAKHQMLIDGHLASKRGADSTMIRNMTYIAGATGSMLSKMFKQMGDRQ